MSNAAEKIDAEIMRTLHRIHRQRSDLQSQIRRGPLQVQAGLNTVEAAKQARDQTKESQKKTKLAADERQLQLRSREQRIDDLKFKLNQAQSNKEYQLIKEQIAADQQANSVLADEILEMLEELDVLAEAVRTKEAELKEAEAKQKKLEGDVQQRVQQAQAELRRVEGELSLAEEQLPVSVRVEYQRIVAARGEDGLAGVEGESCSGCYQTLTTQMMNQLYLSHLFPCPNCGALLYLPEDRRMH